MPKTRDWIDVERGSFTADQIDELIKTKNVSLKWADKLVGQDVSTYLCDFFRQKKNCVRIRNYQNE